MGIFQEMHPQRTFASRREYLELCRMLSEAIANGYVEEVPVINDGRIWGSEQHWYRDKQTTEMYRLVAPAERSLGWWSSIDPTDIVPSTDILQ